ncbi:hypothetical protein HY605_05635 [Candidatus Peregrinibacteria bacterium]|nr:hypothetical protein [Candidatus Peregrinibacteria bacterium]
MKEDTKACLTFFLWVGIIGLLVFGMRDLDAAAQAASVVVWVFVGWLITLLILLF